MSAPSAEKPEWNAHSVNGEMPITALAVVGTFAICSYTNAIAIIV